MLNFDILQNGLGSFSTTLLYDFSKKMFVWLSLLLEILGNMCIAIVCFPGCDAVNFEINLIF